MHDHLISSSQSSIPSHRDSSAIEPEQIPRATVVYLVQEFVWSIWFRA